MKNKKLLLAIISLIVLVIIILTIILISRKKFYEENIVDNDGNIVIEDEPQGDIEEDAIKDREKVINTTYFFSVEECINKYLDAIKRGGAVEVLCYLDENYIQQNNLNKDNILTSIEQGYDFIATEMYEKRDKTLYSFIVKGVIDDDIYNQQKFYIVDLDLSNSTFKVTPLYNNNYTSVEQIQERKKLEKIEQNNFNKFEFLRLTENEIYTKYAEYFVNLLKNNPTRAYDMLDEQYKELRFKNDFNKFTEYINLMNSNNKLDTEIKEISKYDNNKYIVKTKNDNRYIISATYPMEFTVQLDEYTVITDSFKQTYTSASNVKKVSTNVDKIMKMINNYDYENLYNLLDETYKINNFGNINDFINYIGNKFYNSNFYEIMSLEENEENTIIEVKVYKDNSANTEYNINKIVMALNENTNFKFYFE